MFIRDKQDKDILGDNLRSQKCTLRGATVLLVNMKGSLMPWMSSLQVSVVVDGGHRVRLLSCWSEETSAADSSHVCVCHLCAAGRSTGDKPSYWWVGGLGMAVLVLGLVGVLAYLKTRGNTRQNKSE